MGVEQPERDREMSRPRPHLHGPSQTRCKNNPSAAGKCRDGNAAIDRFIASRQDNPSAAGKCCDALDHPQTAGLRPQDSPIAAGKCCDPNVTLRNGVLVGWSGRLDAWLDVGPQLVRRHPVRMVDAADKDPMEFPDGEFAWISSSSPIAGEPWAGDQATLPDRIFDFLPDQPSDVRHRYETGDRNEAYEALSAAMLAYARSETPDQEPARV